MANQNDAHEASPLLGDQNNSDETTHTAAKWSLKDHLDKWWTVYICAIFIIVVDVPSFMSEGPRLRMLELAVCRNFYADHDPSVIDDNGNVIESLCKTPDIQSSLAKMRGILAMEEAIPGLLLAVPYGIAADKWGRTLVLSLSLLGFLLRDVWYFTVLYFFRIFPLGAVYLSPALLVIGGGSTVVGPMLLAVVAASVPQESRTHSFFMIQISFLTTEFIAPPVASLLMESLGPHFAFLSAIPVESLAFIFLLLLPKNKTVQTEDVSLANTDAEDQDTLLPQIRQAAGRLRHYLRHEMSSIFVQRPLQVGLAAMMAAKMSRPILDITLQFMSFKFHWPISKINYLLSLQAACQLPWYLVILPIVNAWLLRTKGDTVSSNRTLAVCLVACLGLGVLLMGLAPSAPTFIIAFLFHTAGSGYTATVRSLLTALIAEDQLSILFTSITVFEGLASLAASPSLQWSFSWGVRKGGLMVSLPYFIAFTLYALCVVSLAVARFSRHK